MAKFVVQGALGKFSHTREVQKVDPSPASAPTHGQDVIRQNRDTLYSRLVLDLTVDAVVIFPEMGGRFTSLSFHSEGHDVFPCAYDVGRYRMSNSSCGCSAPCRRVLPSGEVCTAFGTRYAIIRVRMLVDPDDATDVQAAHKSQDAWQVEQEAPGTWEIPNWNQTELTHTRDLLLELKEHSKAPTTFGFFSGPEKIDHLFGILYVAAGWGAVRPNDQTYVGWVSPAGSQKQWMLTVPQVPIDKNGFWSITVYNKEGFMFALPSNYNSALQGLEGLNSDGSTTVRFGGCEDPARQKPSPTHCLPIRSGWNLVFRFFRPSEAILNGSWVPPEPVPEDGKTSILV